MGIFSKRPPVAVVRGRAFVVPVSTGNLGSQEEGNFNNFSARSRVKSKTVLVAVSAEDGGPVHDGQQRVVADIPNWMRFVMYYAGSNDGISAELPAELHVPVLIDAAARTIHALDVDEAAAELEPHRKAGTREWKETEAPLAIVRNAVKLPGEALRLAKRVPAEARDLVEDIRGIGSSTVAPLSAEEREQQRRTAKVLRFQLENEPKTYAKLRDGAVQHGPQMARSVAAGVYTADHFDAWVEFQELSGVISAEEAATLRATAAEAGDESSAAG